MLKIIEREYIFAVYEHLMCNKLRKVELERQQMILNSIVNHSNIQYTPILELSRKIDSLITDYYNDINNKVNNDEA